MTLSERLEKVASDLDLILPIGEGGHDELRSIAAEVASAQLDAADMVRINANLLATQERLYKEIAELKADLVMKTRFAPTTEAAKQKLLDLVREVKDSLRYAEYREEIDKLAEAERLIVAMKSDFDFLRAESKTMGAEAVRKGTLASAFALKLADQIRKALEA